MGFDFDRGKTRRDEILRRRLLVTLNLARGMAPSGGLSGARLMAETADCFADDMGYESEHHFLQLCRDLKNHDLVNEIALSRRKGEIFGPQHVSYTITAKGTQLLEEQIPPIAGIDDDRIVEGS